MSIEDLRSALTEGDLEATRAALTALDASDCSAASKAANHHRADPSSAFEVFRWIATLPVPTRPLDRENWLRALNNACLLAVHHSADDDARLEIARRAVSFGPRNIAIFHNAACVFCALGALDEALDAVAAAVSHGYGSALLVDDPDLEAIRHSEEFADAIGGARETDERALQRKLAELSAALFDGAEVPDDLSRLWRRHLAVSETRGVGNGGITKLYEEPTSLPSYALPERGLSPLLDGTIWVARLSRPSWVGYFRGPNGDIAPADAPVIGLAPGGVLQVTGDLYDQLRLDADGKPAKQQALRELLITLRIDDTDPSTGGVHERAEEARATVEAFLANR